MLNTRLPRLPSLRLAALAASTVTLSGLDVALLWQLRSARTELTALRQAGLEAAPGATVSAISGLDPRGAPIRLDTTTPGVRTLVLVFSATCRFSEDNLENWQRIIARSQLRAHKELQVVMVDASARSTARYLETHGLSAMSAVVIPDTKTITLLKIGMTPQTIVLEDGRVRRVWSGLLHAEQVAAIEQVLAS